ncbi:MAG TPA: RHS repeat-associated core domain-containing protein [Thermohalobaculum sp.]|nr:RHS repeat-associated core domain-containing protein [Thermohalobaculum sp.]
MRSRGGAAGVLGDRRHRRAGAEPPLPRPSEARFQAGEPDQESLQWSDSPANGLHQDWMRDYDPTTGRYLQADPLGLVDGASVYGYASQGPIRWVDPRGEFIPLPILLLFVASGAAVGGGFEALDQINKYGQVCFWWRVALQGSIGGAAGGFGAAGGAALGSASLGTQLLYQLYNATKFAVVASGVNSVVNRQPRGQAVRSMGVSVVVAVAGAGVGTVVPGLGDVVGRSAPRTIVDDLFGEALGVTTGAAVGEALGTGPDRQLECGCVSGN